MKKTIDRNLLYKPLKPVYYIKTIIRNDSRCNYEYYLIELLNCSSYFMRKTGNQKFQKSEAEYNGECDAISEKYELDFKLLIAHSLVLAKRETSEQIVSSSDGWVAFCAPKSAREFTGTNILQALRNYSLNDISKCEVKSNCHTRLENDIRKLLGNVQKEKNLLLFYPYQMSYQNEVDKEKTIIVIGEALYSDLINVLSYRRKKTSNYETYVATIYDNSLLIFIDVVNNLEYCDKVELSKSKAFEYIKNRYDH